MNKNLIGSIYSELTSQAILEKLLPIINWKIINRFDMVPAYDDDDSFETIDVYFLQDHNGTILTGPFYDKSEIYDNFSINSAAFIYHVLTNHLFSEAALTISVDSKGVCVSTEKINSLSSESSYAVSVYYEDAGMLGRALAELMLLLNK